MATYLRSFPTPEKRLFKNLNDEEFKHPFLTNLKIYISLIATLYRSGRLPLIGCSRTIMLLTTMGRKSDKADRRSGIGVPRDENPHHRVTNYYQVG